MNKKRYYLREAPSAPDLLKYYDTITKGYNVATGKEKLNVKLKTDLPALKVEPSERTIKTAKTLIFTLAGAIALNALSNLNK